VDRSIWPQLEKFTTAIVSRFAKDERIIAWDVYNEQGNGGMTDKSLPLLREAFGWARNSEPEQPLTAGGWRMLNKSLQQINEAILCLSDIITFHNYSALPVVQEHVAHLKSYGRPVVCTEWMARHYDSLFRTHLPFFKQEKIGCYCWGLVSGKTQTYFPWGSSPGDPKPDVWFHDLLHRDGTPYQRDEIEIIRKHIGY